MTIEYVPQPAPPLLPVIPPTLPTAPTYAADFQVWWQKCDVMLRAYAKELTRVAQLNYIAVNVNGQEVASANTNKSAAASQAIATANQSQADAIRSIQNQPVTFPVLPDKDVIFYFARDIMAGGKTGGGLMLEAKAQLAAYKAAIKTPTPAPQ